MKIYVGNLSYDTTQDKLRQTFEAYGEVTTADVVMDRYSGRSRGFGFVEMPVHEEAVAAIAALNEQELDGRNLRVNEARPRGDRGRGGRRRDY
jgi:RNA recognition motif-containing protein